MNEELSSKLIELLGRAEAFAIEHAPDVFQQMIEWEQFMAVAAFLSLVVLSVFMIFTFRFMIKMRADLEDFFIVSVVPFLLFAFFSASVCSGLYATFMPHAFLYDRIISGACS